MERVPIPEFAAILPRTLLPPEDRVLDLGGARAFRVAVARRQSVI
jgi:hypothetical protein